MKKLVAAQYGAPASQLEVTSEIPRRVFRTTMTFEFIRPIQADPSKIEALSPYFSTVDPPLGFRLN